MGACDVVARGKRRDCGKLRFLSVWWVLALSSRRMEIWVCVFGNRIGFGFRFRFCDSDFLIRLGLRSRVWIAGGFVGYDSESGSDLGL